MMLSTCKLTSKVNVLCRHTIRIFHTYITANRQIQQRQRNGSDDRRSQLKIGLSNRRASERNENDWDEKMSGARKESSH